MQGAQRVCQVAVCQRVCRCVRRRCACARRRRRHRGRQSLGRAAGASVRCMDAWMHARCCGRAAPARTAPVPAAVELVARGLEGRRRLLLLRCPEDAPHFLGHTAAAAAGGPCDARVYARPSPRCAAPLARALRRAQAGPGLLPPGERLGSSPSCPQVVFGQRGALIRRSGAPRTCRAVGPRWCDTGGLYRSTQIHRLRHRGDGLHATEFPTHARAVCCTPPRRACLLHSRSARRPGPTLPMRTLLLISHTLSTHFIILTVSTC